MKYKALLIIGSMLLSGCIAQQETIQFTEEEKIDALGGNSFRTSENFSDEIKAICTVTKPIPTGENNTSTELTFSDIESSLPRIQWGGTLVIVNQSEESVVFDEPNASTRYIIDLKTGNLSIIDKTSGRNLNSGSCKIEVGVTADQKEFLETTFLESCLKSPQEIQSPEDYAEQQADPVMAHTISPENEVNQFSTDHSTYYQEILCTFQSEFEPPFGRGNELEFHDIFDANPLVSPQCTNWRTLVIVEKNQAKLVFDEANEAIQYIIDLNNKQALIKEKFTQKIINTGTCTLFQRMKPTEEQWDAMWQEMGLTPQSSSSISQ